MNSRSRPLGVIGVVVLLLGIVFALQGANVIGGSSVMSGDSTYIYVGGIVAVVGLIILVRGMKSGGSSTPSTQAATSKPAAK